jgi:uncharacterized protein (TIGR02246 family)
MIRTSLGVTISIAMTAGLAIGFAARGAMDTGVQAQGQKDTRAADLAAIEKLHRADEACTLTQEPTCLTSLWSDDGVNFGFPGPPVVGIKAMGEAYAKFRADYPEFQVLKYKADVREVQIVENWAIEVEHTNGTFKMAAKGDPQTTAEDGMRVLKKQSDGSWKFLVVGLK